MRLSKKALGVALLVIGCCSIIFSIVFLWPREQTVMPIREIELAPGEAEEDFQAARAAIAEIHSGRIVYTMQSMYPKGMSREAYESSIKSHTAFLRKRGLSEKAVKEEMEKRKKEWSKRLNLKGYHYMDYEGEYLFEGGNVQHTVHYVQNPDLVYEGYVYENESTSVTIDLKTGTAQAQIFGRPQFNNKVLTSPLHFLKDSDFLLQTHDGWRITRETTADRETEMYHLYDPEHPANSFEVEIAPHEGFITKSIGRVSSRGFFRVSFEDFQVDPSGARYPRKVIESRVQDGEVEGKFTYDLLEVELNRDYDDALFRPSLAEGAVITDYRVTPPKTYRYKKNAQNEQADADKNG
jgi:hypothetical protein